MSNIVCACVRACNDCDDAVCSLLTIFQMFVSNCWCLFELLFCTILDLKHVKFTHVPANAPVAHTSNFDRST